MMAIMASSSWSDEAVSRIDGKKLYQMHCSGCHSDISNTVKGGRSINRVRTAIRMLDQHSHLSSLSDEDILLIAMVLKEVQN
jgi:mono/diheme cytochrome c family protein